MNIAMDSQQIFAEATLRSPLALPLKTVLNNQYQVGRILGIGGFGITYLTLDQRLQTPVAIKEFLPRDVAGRSNNGSAVQPHTIADTDTFSYGLEKFLQEARTLAQFNHPNIVRVRTFFEANDTAYLVMDYVEGISLIDYLKQHGERLGEVAATRIMMAVLNGLRTIHDAGFLHRDVKPENVYLRHDDVPVLLDFGMARMALGQRSQSLTQVLTPGYAPYEQYSRKGKQGAWTDVYAAGATLYRMVTGHMPAEVTDRVIEDELRPAADYGVSPELSAVLEQALALRPEHRIQTIKGFQDRLIEAVPGAVQHPGPPPKDRPGGSGKKSPWRKALWIAGSLVGITIAAVAVFLVLTKNVPPVANEDEASTTENQDVFIYPLDNDDDTDGDEKKLTIVKVSDAVHGTAEKVSDTQIRYTPNGEYYGEEKITYTISDERGATAVSTITITIRKSDERRQEEAEFAEALSLFSGLFLDHVHEAGYTESRVLLFDRFNDNENNWKLAEGDAAVQINNGKLYMEQRKTGYTFRVWQPIEHEAFIARYEIQQITGEPTNGGGMTFLETDDYYHNVVMSGNGGFKVRLRDKPGNDWTLLKDWTVAPGLREKGNVNIIELFAAGNELVLFINGEHVTTVRGLASRSGRWIGFLVSDHRRLAFDNLSVMAVEK